MMVEDVATRCADHSPANFSAELLRVRSTFKSEGSALKHAATLLSLACAASLITSSGAAAAVRMTTLGAPAVQTNFTESPAWADSFADSVGVDASFEDHSYGPAVIYQLEWSGIRHLRDGGPLQTIMTNTYATLGQHGIKHSIGLLRGFADSDLTSRLNAWAPYVDYVEPSNEADNYPVPNYGQMKSDQQRIWTIIHSNPAYSHVAVMGPSFANPINGLSVLPLDPVEDFAQLHASTCDWNPGTTNGASLAIATGKVRQSASKPIITTETGYQTDMTRGCSLPNSISAKYVPRTSAVRWLAGEPRTYFDFLVDNPASVAFGGLGLLTVNGTPKPQFLTEGNLIHLVSDKGAAPARTTVSYALNGITADVDHIMLARQDGSYDLLLWRELPDWDHTKRAPIVVPALPVTVLIPHSTSYVGLFQYNSNYNFTRVQLPVSKTGVTATFNVTDAITVLHIYGRSATTSIRR